MCIPVNPQVSIHPVSVCVCVCVSVCVWVYVYTYLMANLTYAQQPFPPMNMSALRHDTSQGGMVCNSGASTLKIEIKKVQDPEPLLNMKYKSKATITKSKKKNSYVNTLFPILDV